MTFTIYLGLFMRNPIIPLHFQTLGASLIEIGFITSAFMLVAASMAIPLGIVSDRLGRRRLVIVGSTVSALSSLLLVIANSPAFAILINACAGLGSAAYSPAITAFVGDISQSNQRGRVYGYYTTVMQTAMALGPGVGGGIADLFKSYRFSFIISGLIIMIGAVIGLLFFPRDEAKTETSRSGKDFALLLRRESLLTSWVVTFSISFMWSVSSTYIPLYASEIGLTATEIGLLFTIQAATNALGRFPIGVLYDRIKEHSAMILASVLIGVFVTASISTATSTIILFTLMGMFGIALGTATMATNATIAESLSQTSRGVGMGAYYLFFYGGMAAGPAMLGPVISVYGFQEGFLLAAGVGLTSTLLVFALRARSRHQTHI